MISRHYHDVGLLEPAEIDAHSGYRYYRPEQVRTARLIRRFRDLDLPIEQVREVLRAPDEDSRDRVIVAHLDRMSRQLGHLVAAGVHRVAPRGRRLGRHAYRPGRRPVPDRVLHRGRGRVGRLRSGVRRGPVSGEAMPYVVPEARLAVATYDGPMVDLDEAYGAVGQRLLERANGGDGPVRERYLPLGDPADLLNHRTEVCWPIRT